MAKLHDDLKRLNACSEAQEWVKGYKTLSAAWAKCDRPDWMLWLIGETGTSEAWSEERKPIVLCACEIARTALPYTDDLRVLQCIETMEAWCRGEATQARSAARSAAYKQSADIVRKHYPKPPKIG